MLLIFLKFSKIFVKFTTLFAELNNDFLFCGLNKDLPFKGSFELQSYLFSFLFNDGFIELMKDPESTDDCSASTSYVLVKLSKKDTAEYEYEACLECGDYRTVSGTCWRIVP